ncbi:septation ring formation regulator EzrA [Lacticaseibacillus pabuli]|uniref:Septation ring formation regulator EzrA n=1 Tax=Lacticaseibacillus pabuli TaxID=3025672 RepID=A0ABY7WRC8_9LACO|nr:septation ring formation regulator EzrA [Lacticaseibacillus sp. KACC 23028]WDF81695.1 septation ring formation regulator EzrA [Lacticaseibacillus sp. KACC 23028]
MIWMVIGLIVLILVVLGAVFGFREYFKRQIHSLDTRASTMGTDEIEKQIHTIRGLQLNGESLKLFTRYQREYQQLSESDGADIETKLMELDTANAQMRFGTVRTGLQETEDLLTRVKNQYGKINLALQGIYQAEEKNRKALSKLRRTYDETRKTLLAKNFAFGESMPALEDRLKDLGDEFDRVDKVNASGDHQAAADQIQTLKSHVSALADLCAKIPVQLSLLVKEFPEQLAEIQSGYQKLHAQHYNFPAMDIPETINQVKVGITNSKTALFGLNIEASTKQNKDLAGTIDELYGVMETEMKAHQAIEGRDDRITQFVAHAQRQNRILMQELDHLNQSYQLTHGELDTARDLKSELSELRIQHESDLQDLADNKAIYSTIQKHYDHAEGRLREIEQQQADIDKNVSGLKAGEKSANDALEGFARDLRAVARELENMSLPGLPQDFKEQFAHVQQVIRDIDTDLSKVKINLDEIGEELIGLQSDMDDLKQAATEIIDAVGMTAQLLQAANRYGDEHPELKDARIKARAQYNQMEYQKAADTIAAALETAVPGSYQKVEDAYLSDKTKAPL